MAFNQNRQSVVEKFSSIHNFKNSPNNYGMLQQQSSLGGAKA